MTTYDGGIQWGVRHNDGAPWFETCEDEVSARRLHDDTRALCVERGVSKDKLPQLVRSQVFWRPVTEITEYVRVDEVRVKDYLIGKGLVTHVYPGKVVEGTIHVLWSEGGRMSSSGCWWPDEMVQRIKREEDYEE